MGDLLRRLLRALWAAWSLPSLRPHSMWACPAAAVNLGPSLPVTVAWTEHDGETMLKRFAAVFVVVLVGAAGLVAPAQAAQPTGNKFASCAKLLDKYPNGVARNKKARNRAVKQGFERPQVRKKVYRKNRKRLDKDRDGVLCAQEKPAMETPQETEPPANDSAVLYIPTGIRLVDVLYGAQAARGDISSEQAVFVTAWASTLGTQNVSQLCTNWRSRTFQNAFLDTVATSEVAASSNLPGQEAWIRETGQMVTTMFCVDLGYNYQVMLP